jgi:hypothetical protein
LKDESWGYHRASAGAAALPFPGKRGSVWGFAWGVAATPQFTPKVADAPSELLRDVFGDQTISSRLVFGVASLPLGSSVELEVILEVKP